MESYPESPESSGNCRMAQICLSIFIFSVEITNGSTISVNRYNGKLSGICPENSGNSRLAQFRLSMFKYEEEWLDFGISEIGEEL